MIWTSNYFTAWGQPNTIRISNGMPKGFISSGEIKELYPKWVWVKAKYPTEVFDKLYNELLSTLNVHEIAQRSEGKILCCFENISKAHCHRELVRDWFIKNGYPCEEWKRPVKLGVEPPRPRTEKKTKKQEMSLPLF
jgi:hypothetical protein